MTLAIVHLWRFARWGRTLARFGALKPLETIKEVPLGLRVLVRVLRFGVRVSDPPRYADALHALGPAAIKLGQALATRPDLVGLDVAQELARLQDNLPPAPFAQVKAQIEAQFGATIDKIYKNIDETAVGAASIAQVYKAVTTDGRLVAVKVLRPNIHAELKRAIDTYMWGAAQLERLGGEAARLRPRQVLASFQGWINRELDFFLEAASASELHERMEGEPNYVVPAIDWARTTRMVLTQEWIDGTKLTDLAALKARGLDLPALAVTLVRTFLKQAIEDGFFHADVHQGNMFVDREGRLAVIDFGIMGRIDPLARRYLAEILYGLISRNYMRVAQIHFDAGYVPAYHNIADFACALRAVSEPILGMPIKDISPARLLDQLFSVTRVFDMETQPHLLLLQKTMVMVEGLAVHLDPNANMWEIAEPYLTKWVRSELGPETVVADTIHQFLRDIAILPDTLRRLTAMVPKKGAAPPQRPLPPLVEPKSPGWGRILAGIAIGIAIGAALWWHP